MIRLNCGIGVRGEGDGSRVSCDFWKIVLI